jgi:hypothetical protein
MASRLLKNSLLGGPSNLSEMAKSHFCHLAVEKGQEGLFQQSTNIMLPLPALKIKPAFP